MIGESGFLVEDFLQAIASQLDRTQDALALKAVSRPLTYAVREFSLELKVFVEMDDDGNVRLRSSGPNESGASTIQIGFTTITRPMIEENTVSLAATRSPSLEEIGLDQRERQRLERVGVRNAAQLERLRASTGTSAMSRLSGIPVDRLRQALQLGRPQVRGIRTEVSQPPPVQGSPPSTPPPAATPPILSPPAPRLPLRPDRVSVAPEPPAFQTPTPRPDSPIARPPLRPDAAVAAPVLRVSPEVQRLHLSGANLIGVGGPPRVTLNRQPLALHEADDDRIVVELPPGERSGALEIELDDGEVLTYALSPDLPVNGYSDSQHNGVDPWGPRRM